MAKHDVDPVLRQLVRAVNESGQAAVPVTVTVHGTTLTGTLIAQSRHFSELAAGNPLMSALEPASGLLGQDCRAAAGPVSAGQRSPTWRKKTFPWPGWPRDTPTPSPFWPSSVPGRLQPGAAGESGPLSHLVPA